ncbi:DUF5107 domain-containing protein [Olivibacter sp. CPCC 100613]|uniref:DUF5107 domain-containing protein n=1 Tax=Olivibacter sp. CPCC 100613 TaxID=3079931 RepID=UPI002FF45FE0
MNCRLILLLWLLPFLAQAQQEASIRETMKRYTTYPFSDPDPIPSEKIYPYFRFDGFTEKAISKEWKIVELENDFLKLQIMPEIGGKIWTAYDKKGKRDFIYNNEVIKFRDIAMRGPWTSGGIEANYGIIGHTPNTSTPVDYLTRKNKDGSVSCFISTLDLLTRTRWTIEIKLEKDKAYFSTRSFWTNSNPIEQPYYTWMNLGVPAGDDLQFLYPGSHYIGHDGESHSWPIDEMGRNLSRYKENDFGGSKSYHVLGVHSNYFSAYWEASDYGMIRFADREDKLGKKIFLWAQSGEGKIWEQLLTDKSGQYVEIQSGRLFNQNMFKSSFTPFKQIGFAPYQTDTWIEYWYPYQGIGKPTVSRPLATLGLSRQNEGMRLRLQANSPIRDRLIVYNTANEPIHSISIDLPTGGRLEQDIPLASTAVVAKLKLQDEVFDIAAQQEQNRLNRPLTKPVAVDSSTAYGLYLQGRDLMRFRNYREALPKIRQSLKRDPFLLPALVEMTKLKLFHLQYDSAYIYAQKALRVDTYFGEANYYYGLAAAHLGKIYDAMDAFEVASLDPSWRSAAYTRLSALYMERKEYVKSLSYSQKALDRNEENVFTLQLQYLGARLSKKVALCDTVKRRLSSVDPLNHFLRFEQYFANKSNASRADFVSLIRNELPTETYLELAVWYANLHLTEEAREVLTLAPKNAEVLYWLAWLSREHPAESEAWLKQVDEIDLAYNFPFREESAMVFEWGIKKHPSWQSFYLMALLQQFRNNRSTAENLLQQVQGPVDFAPFYILRAKLLHASQLDSAIDNVKKAIEIDEKEWRYGQLLANYLQADQQDPAAEKVLQAYYKKEPENYVIGLDYVRALLLNKKAKEAEGVLQRINILPFEGATDGRKLYEQTKLLLAIAALNKGQLDLTLKKVQETKLWPLNLGVGEPYTEEKDERMADWVAAQAYKEMRKTDLYTQALEKVANAKGAVLSPISLLQTAALVRLERKTEANEFMQSWLMKRKQQKLEPMNEKLIEEALAGQVNMPSLMETIFSKSDERLF